MSILILLGFALAAVAGPQPLSNKEIALMLRTGYSSQDLLGEILRRRVLDPLDDATRKSLVQFGASAQLIAALESKTYLVSATQAEEALLRQAEIDARRAAQVEQDRQYNVALQAQAESRAKAAGAAANPAPAPGETLVLDALKRKKLMRCHDGSVRPADGSELENKKLVALYFSAHWCAPCRKFTPKLVEYYNRVASAHPEFELIFVSSDRSRYGWETYIQETQMPWLAIDYDELARFESLKKLGGESIPSLLVLDQGSQIVASSYDGDKYVGPENALAVLDRMFAGTSDKPVAQTR